MEQLIVGCSLWCIVGLAAAAGFDGVAQMQKTWKITETGSKRPPRLYCVTEQQKLDARKSLAKAGADGNCKISRDTLNGNQFELRMQCRLDSQDKKDGGTMLMTMLGTATPTDIRYTLNTKVSGDGPMIKQLAEVLGKERAEHWRWTRACRAGEKPGTQ